LADGAPGRLKTVLGRYPYVAPLRARALTDPRVALDFVEVEPVPKAFAPMIRRLEYDLSEMAVVSALQAFAFGKPLVLLPAVVASRFQRGCLIRHRDRPLAGPEALVGRRIGVRSFTQTTGMWVRAALYEDHGLLADEMRWRVSEGAHLDEYLSPPFVEWDHSGKSLPDQLRDGDIAAAIMGADLPRDPEFVPVLADHEAADRAWHDRHGWVPINHMVVVRADVAEAEPEAVRAAYGLIKEAAAGAYGSLFGTEALRGPLAFIAEEARRQELLPYPVDIDELLDPAWRILGE
jgi:4,5-dihydroxyphthalate decarboxylase